MFKKIKTKIEDLPRRSLQAFGRTIVDEMNEYTRIWTGQTAKSFFISTGDVPIPRDKTINTFGIPLKEDYRKWDDVGNGYLSPQDFKVKESDDRLTVIVYSTGVGAGKFKPEFDELLSKLKSGKIIREI